MEVEKDNKVYRCEYCHKCVLDEDVQLGGCVCGSRRVKIATAVTDEEAVELRERGYDFEANGWMDRATADQERRLAAKVQE